MSQSETRMGQKNETNFSKGYMKQLITLPTYTIVPHVAHDWGGNLKFALTAKEFSITNPFESECGRFEVNPVAHYGICLDDANQLVDLNNRLAIA